MTSILQEAIFSVEPDYKMSFDKALARLIAKGVIK